MVALLARASFVTGLVCLGLAPVARAQTQDDLVFLHHSCGRNWLDNDLHDALLAKDYVDERNDIYYGTDVPPDSGRPDSLGSAPGDSTNMNHWVRWFNDYLEGVRQHGCDDGVNRIVMFKSCYPASNIAGDGAEPGDPFSSSKTLANYRAVYRHPDGPGAAYEREGDAYQPLEDVFAAHPETLFIPVTAPPRHYTGSDDDDAHRARVFNDWLKNDWLDAYDAAHPGLNNVAVFDWFDVLAYGDDHPTHPNRLTAEYGGTSGNSHPNTAANLASTAVFATDPDNFLDAAWAAFISEPGPTRWVGGTGNWHVEANWDAGLPAAGRDVHIDAGEALLAEGTAEMRDLHIGVAGTGVLTWAGGTLDANSVTVGAGGRLAVATWTDWTWAGELHVRGGAVEKAIGRIRLDAGATATLAGGSIAAMGLTVAQDAGAGFHHSAGELADGFDLFVGRGAGSDGEYVLTGSGEVRMDVQYIGHQGKGTFRQSGGRNEARLLWVGHLSGGEGTYEISGGRLDVGDLRVGAPAANGTLRIAHADAELAVSDKLVLNGGGVLEAVAGSVIRMEGADLEISTTGLEDLAGLGNVTLVFCGGQDASLLEAPEPDRGPCPDPPPLTIGALQLGADGHAGKIELVDAFDNDGDPHADEALYVEELILNAGAAVELGGLRLYYRNGGEAKQFFPGDADLSGAVDALDYMALKRHAGSTGAGWADGDYDGDRTVGRGDLALLRAYFGRTTPPPPGPMPVPEPAALSLLATAVPWLAARRRRR